MYPIPLQKLEARQGTNHGNLPTTAQEAVELVEPIKGKTPKPVKKKAKQPVAKQAPRQTARPYSGGGREDWLRAVGIPQSQWYFVDCVIAGCEGISGEAGWGGVTRWNTAGSGAYGICQSLPASKMASAGSDYMTSGLTQLRWCDSYAKSRYGGWAAAWNFRKCTGMCTNPHIGWTGHKDHTWW